MSCETLISIEKPCGNNIGGIKTVWIAPQDDVTATITGWEVTNLVLTNPAAVYAINRNTGNYTEDTAIDLINGSTFVTQTITLMVETKISQRLSMYLVQDSSIYLYLYKIQMISIGTLKMHN